MSLSDTSIASTTRRAHTREQALNRTHEAKATVGRATSPSPPPSPPAARSATAEHEHSFGVAPDMGRKLKVKVLLESRQTESNTEDKGGSARSRLVEVVGAARNRAKAKHRKALVPRVSQPPVAKPESVERPGSIGDGVRVKLSDPYSGRPAGFRGDTVTAKDERANMGSGTTTCNIIPIAIHPEHGKTT